MGGYIKIDKDLPDDPRVLAIADAYLEYWRNQAGLTDQQLEALRPGARHQALGAVVTLWCYIDTHLDAADTIKCATRQLSDVTNIPLHVLLKWPVEWLQDNGNGTLRAPHYSDKNIILDKEQRREQTRRRVAEWRAEQLLKDRNASVPESNKPKRYKSVTTGTGTILDRDPVKSAPPAAPSKGRAAAPRKPPDPVRPQSTESTWESHSPPHKPRPEPKSPRTQAEVIAEWERERDERFDFPKDKPPAK